MPPEKPRFVNVDELMPQISLEQAAAFYGIQLPGLHRTGEEVRMRCFLNCGKSEETGDRALAIKADHPAKQWKCHHYGCGKGGNLVGLCDLMKPGPNSEGRPRGERFKAIAADLRAMASGVTSAETIPAERDPKQPEPKQSKPKFNVPLKDSENERARALVDLDEKFVVDVAQMNPKASAYFRQRPFLTADVCRKWRMGHLPRDTGGERSGGTMRGKIVYPMLSGTGDVLTWFGRDPEYEAKRANWEAAGRTGRHPEKFHFIKNFHRGLELFGQHGQQRLGEEAYRETIAELGLIVVEGPNDVIALDCLGVPAVGLCSNTITAEQVKKLARWARQLAGGKVTLMLDCDAEGETGTKQAAYELAQQCHVRIAWSPALFGGKFRGHQPESLSSEEWEIVRDALGR